MHDCEGKEELLERVLVVHHLVKFLLVHVAKGLTSARSDRRGQLKGDLGAAPAKVCGELGHGDSA